MIRCHTLLMPAMTELYWDAFEAWTLEQPDGNLDVMASVSGSIQDLAGASGRQERDAALQARANPLDEGKHVNQMLSEFDATLESNPTGRLWLMYIHMVLISTWYLYPHGTYIHMVLISTWYLYPHGTYIHMVLISTWYLYPHGTYLERYIEAESGSNT